MNRSTVISTVLTCLGGAGVIATAVLAAKGASKAAELLDKARDEKGDELTVVETIKTAAPAYVPAAVTGAATVACIFSAGILNKSSQASIAGAYALLDRSYKQYRTRAREFFGDIDCDKLEESLDVEEYEDGKDPEHEYLFCDMTTLQYFNSSLEKVTMDDGLECYVINTPYDISR